MQNTTLCYIECNGYCLLMHRTKKAHDVNEGKWVGIGGHIEEGEKPEECAVREIKEETGLMADTFTMRYCGIVTFISNNSEGEYMHLFKVKLQYPKDIDSSKEPPPYTNGQGGVHLSADAMPPLIDCDEGDLEWIPLDKVNSLPQWEGDKIFLQLIREEVPFFKLTLSYKGGHLLQAVLNGKPCLPNID